MRIAGSLVLQSATALSLVLTFGPAAHAQLVNGALPGVPAGAGGTSAAIGGGTMGPYTGSVPGGTTAAVGGGTMGPTIGGGFSGLSTGSGYQAGPLGANGLPMNGANNGQFNSGLNAGSLSGYNAGSPSLANPGFSDQGPIQPLRIAVPEPVVTVPQSAPTANGISGISQTAVDTFGTTQSTGFSLPVPGTNPTGTLRNAAAVPTAQ